MDTTLIIISGIAGILIGQTNGFLERRNEKKKALNLTLCELLEIRHRFKGSLYMLRRLATDIELPYEHYDEVISSLPNDLLWDEAITHRYNEAINTISMYSPILAYVLRSKDIVKLFCNGAPVTFGTSKETHTLGLENISAIENAVLPSIEESIEVVAELLGKKQKKLITRLVTDTKEVLPEVMLTTDQIIANIRKVIELETDKALNSGAEKDPLPLN